MYKPTPPALVVELLNRKLYPLILIKSCLFSFSLVSLIQITSGSFKKSSKHISELRQILYQASSVAMKKTQTI